MRRAAACAVLLLAGCGNGATTDTEGPAELPGAYAEIIASETDCDALQEIFDTVEGSTLDGREDVMAAADERMAEVGCY